MNEDVFKKAFENVKPSEELVKSVLDVQNVPCKAKHQSFSVKRVFCAVAAVCAVCACGMTAAAVTGVINFKELFASYFSANDDEFADSLVGTVKNFSYKVSDEDYKIEVKGITGTEEGLFAVAEISRVDGEPAADHFANPMYLSPENKDFPTNKNYITPSWIERSADGEFFPAQYSSYVNGEKNIELCISLPSSQFETSESVTVRGENFYPSYKYWDFMKENNVTYVRYQEPKFSGYVYCDWESDYSGTSNADFTPVDFDDSSIIALDLDWEFTFTPVPSKQAKKTKAVKKFDKDFVYLENVYDKNDYDPNKVIAEYERVLTPTSIEVKALGTYIDFTFPMPNGEYDDYDKYIVSSDNINNKVSLIFKDGSTLAASITNLGYSINDSGTGYSGNMTIIYQDFSVEDSKPAVVDVKDVKAISINGTVYELK